MLNRLVTLTSSTKGKHLLDHKGELVYIAGPYRGDNAWEVEQNIRVAEEVGMAVAKMGVIPLIPHTMYRYWDGTLTDEFWLGCGLRLLESCKAITLCPNWEKSSGTLGERKRAKELGLDLFFASFLYV
jgi:hypothetical protein